MLDDLPVRNDPDEDQTRDCLACKGWGFTDPYDEDHSFCTACNGQGYLDEDAARYQHLL
jgi:DnaJ-class molecular chaperone